MTDAPAATPPPTLAGLGERMAADVAGLEREIAEIDLLIAQARSEAARHEERRAQTADRVAEAAGSGDLAATTEAHARLLTLTRRAALMDSQVEVLEGKRRALVRYREAVAAYGEAVDAIDPGAEPVSDRDEADPPDDGAIPGDVARLLLTTQEDLRREIARAMHDGPAQSLTNIVLQAQIVERLVTREPAAAGDEVRRLVAMVQQTLEATKSFIFDVRPMVLDDLGLVPTLRRAARERGRRAGIPVEFGSAGPDRRLPMELESGLFRILDEALVAFLSVAPDRVVLDLDWSEGLEARLVAAREAAAAETERRGADPALPGSTWRAIRTRAASMGMDARLTADGTELRVTLVTAGPGGEA